MKIKIINYTQNPLTVMGEGARRCWGTPSGREVEIAKDCIKANHGRVLEFADVTMELSEVSARVIREIYTHIVGTSRLQESTRYVNLENFDYIIPPKVKRNKEALEIYNKTMESIQQGYLSLLKLGIPKEDVANLLPLGSHSKMVLKINVRALIHMANERLCTRTYWEFRNFVNLLKRELSQLDSEWEYIVSIMVPKCERLGYCPEMHSCGLYSQRDD